MNLLAFELNRMQLEENQFRFSAMIFSFIEKNLPLLAGKIASGEVSEEIIIDPLMAYLIVSGHHDQEVLKQLVFGYTVHKKDKESLSLMSDQFGCVYVPNLGHFTAKANAAITLVYLSTSNQYVVDGLPISFQSIDSQYFIIYTVSPLIMEENKEKQLNTAILATIDQHIPNLEKGLDCMQHQVPEFLEVIKNTTDYLSIYSAQHANSFASINYPATAFLNTYGEHQNMIFFLDDMAHQCGHVIFNMLTIDTNEYLAVPKTALLQKFTGNMVDQRTVYGAFHGLFTYTCILHTLTQVLNQANLQEETEMELLGRIGFYMTKFKVDLQNMSTKGILTHKGKHYLEQFMAGYKLVFRKHAAVTTSFNYQNQPYIFCFDRFKAMNSLTV